MPLALRLERLQGAHLAQASLIAIGRAMAQEWRGSDLHHWLSDRPRPDGFALQPRDYRPADIEAGRRVLTGTFRLAGETIATGAGGDPWDRVSPSRAFAEALHRFDWLPDLIAVGPDGAAEALRLVLEWRRLFGRWNSFAWDPQVMARRVFHLACAGPSLTARASDAETAQIAADLARQARDLLTARAGPGAAEGAIAAAVAGVALKGLAGGKLLDRALDHLARSLPRTLRPDGIHASRKASTSLELLFDLQTLDEAMGQRGLAAPEAVQRAIDGLARAVRYLTLADGGLATGQGGLPRDAAYVAAARALDLAEDRPLDSALGGYQRMESRRLQVMVDVGPPPAGRWSLDAAATPLSVQILAGRHRLIDFHAGRALETASSIQVGDGEIGHQITGFSARVLGARLVGADADVEAQRHEGPGAVWLDLAHQGWNRSHGVMHQRRLYLDLEAGDLRGEDRLTPTARAQGPDGRHFVPYVLRFQLHPAVRALVAQDRRSVLLRVAGDADGWILRNDLLDMSLEPSPRVDRPGQQLVLRGQRRADSGARVRWRLSAARPSATTVAPTVAKGADLIEEVAARVDARTPGA